MAPNLALQRNQRALAPSLFTAAAVLALALATSAPLRADSLDAAKAASEVVEQANGLLAACPGAPASVSASVRSINAERLKQYQEIAASTGAALDQVQARAGARLTQASPGGCR